jgi:LysM repeat protein
MPEFTISLPLAMLFLLLALVLGGGGVYFTLSQMGTVVEPTPISSPTITATVTITPTGSPPTATHTPQPSLTPFTHKVLEEETCSAIAARYGSSIMAIIQENILDANCSLRVGQELRIPQPTSTATPLASPTPNATQLAIEQCETEIYTVQEGDTLESISLAVDLPIAVLQVWNGLSSNQVFEDQVLTIPYCQQLVVDPNTPTPTLVPTHTAPHLLLPVNGASFTLADDSVILQWTSSGPLRENEAYQVSIINLTVGEERSLTVEVTDSKFIIPETFRPSGNEPHIFIWSVTPVEKRDVDEQGNLIWWPTGDRSETRLFTWVGTLVDATTQPQE